MIEKLKQVQKNFLRGNIKAKVKQIDQKDNFKR